MHDACCRRLLMAACMVRTPSTGMQRLLAAAGICCAAARPCVAAVGGRCVMWVAQLLQ